MDNIEEEKTNAKRIETENPYSYFVSVEDRLKVIANLVVDRLIEDQQHGTLRLRSIKKNNYE